MKLLSISGFGFLEISTMGSLITRLFPHLGCPPSPNPISPQAAGEVLSLLHTVQGRGAGCRDRVCHGLRECHHADLKREGVCRAPDTVHLKGWDPMSLSHPADLQGSHLSWGPQQEAHNRGAWPIRLHRPASPQEARKMRRLAAEATVPC